MGLTFRFALGAIPALALAATPARADWTGKLHIHTEPAGQGPGDVDGQVYGKGLKLRIEMTIPQAGKVDSIFDMKSREATMVMEEHHAFMTIDADQSRGGMGQIHCEGAVDAASCLKASGFTKTGAETVNGKKCDRWEADRESQKEGKIHETLWVPPGAKEIQFVKQTAKSAEHTVTLDVTGIKEGAQPDSLFAPPEGYQEMHMPGGMGGPGMGHGPGGMAPPPGH